jgi:hypothetical protein
MHDPETPEQWQEAVDAAHVMLLVQSAEKYGLIETDAEVNVGRCLLLALIEEGRVKHGVVPSPDAASVRRQQQRNHP